ncbi:MAG: DHH family phosphoesterase [Lachnospiraceae bacterium]|nr:DHH family phosphoesterase [Lachnospiraceae bacterium]
MNRNSKLIRFINAYMRWPLYLLLLTLAMDICLYAAQPNVLYIALIYTGMYIVILICLYFRKSRRLNKQLTEFGFRFNQVQRKMLLDLKVPYAMLDREGTVLWANDEFQQITGMYLNHYYEIGQFFPNVTRQELQECVDETELFYDIGGMQFRLQLKNVPLEEQEEGDQDGKGEVIALYLYDETEIRRLYRESEERRMAVGMIYIDNYEEALEGINEVNGSLLPALVERKINQYMRNNDAVVKKTEKDKFLILFQNKYLSAMKGDNFRIMDDVRSLHIGNTVNITISIGIGICDENNYSFLAAFEAAKSAINRALERGGDQVVVRGDSAAKNNDAEGCSYYGGKSDSVAKSSKVRSRVKTEAICEQIRAAESILIMGHKKGDADSFGATIGMYRIARFFTNRVNIVLDETMKTVAMLFEQYKQGKSYEEGMFINNAEAVRRVDKGTLVIVVDVNAENRTECPDILPEAGNIVVIDHHREKNPINAKVTYAESYASSTCELITEMLQHLEETGKREQAEKIIQIRESDADVIYAGILLDTNSFITKTGVRTFEAAAWLKRKGADMTRVRKCFRQDRSSVYEKARIINSAEIFMGIYGFAVNDCDTADEAVTEIGAQVANDLLDIEDVKASFVFTPKDGVIYVSARAMDEANVELIMNRCGGGGHKNMAGTQMRDCAVEEAVQRVKDIITEMTQKGEI